MAPLDGDVEQLLASGTATPITQLNPDLSDQVTRSIHGEITITWPYSSINKRFAFLLAESDFRLRREKGQVRIVLNGPSAEAVSDLELGSGDEVTLALDGVEWAKDEEPARPPGSRLDWQLKFAGKLILKVTLGETGESKFIHVNQPATTEAPEPVHSAEIDTASVDDESPIEDAPALPTTAEYAAPIFTKRSLGSYGPLFDFDLDGELEVDGGRKGKGRKRPRYSVQNGRWRYREESDSPEPELLQATSSPASEKDADVSMQITPSKPQMEDGACQTEENEISPPSQTIENTPSKSFDKSESSAAFGDVTIGRAEAAAADTGVQVSPFRETVTVPSRREAQQQPVAASASNLPNPFGFVPSHSGFPQIESSVRAGFGMSQPQASAHLPTDQDIQASASSRVGSYPAQPNFGQSSNIATGFGVIGGPLVDSVRFGFGEQPQSMFAGMQFASSQLLPQYSDSHYYPASHPDLQESRDHTSPASHYSHRESRQNAQYDEDPQTTSRNISSLLDQAVNHEVPLWPIETQNLNPSNAIGHLNAPEELRSDGSVSEKTPPGMIPPAVEDGTRNRDEMRDEGILTAPVFEQGVPREALPHGREGSADEDEGSMDSDEEADYDEDEKGDDYDMRNYDRLSDDDDGFDGEEEPLPDGEMLDEDGDEIYDDEEDYDEEDYEDDEAASSNYYQQAPQSAPQPPVQDPVVIDLLSDTDEEDEAPKAPLPPRTHVERHQMDGITETELPDVERGGDLSKEGRPQHALPILSSPQPALRRQQFVEAEQRQELEEKLEQELEEQIDNEAGASSSHDERSPNGEDASGSEYNEADGDESEVEEDEPDGAEVSKDLETITENLPITSSDVVPEVEETMTLGPPQPHDQASSGVADVSGKDLQVEEATTPSPPQPHDQASSGVADVSGEALQVKDVAVKVAGETQQRTGQNDDRVEIDDSHLSKVDSFQTQPVELAAAPQTQSGAFSETFQTQTADIAMTDLPESSPGSRLSQEDLNEDVVMDEAQLVAVPGEDAGEAGSENRMLQSPPREESNIGEEDEMEGDEAIATEIQTEEVALEDKTFEGFSDDEHDATLFPSGAQNQKDHSALGTVDISVTTVSSHFETHSSDKEISISETQETEVVHNRFSQADEVPIAITDEKDVEMAESVAAPGKELEGDGESVKDGRSASIDEARVDVENDLDTSEAESEPLENENVAVSSPPQRESESAFEKSIEGPQEEVDQAASEFSDEDFHDASELPEADGTHNLAQFDDRASFITADSRVSESRETEEPALSPTTKSTRKGRNQKIDSGDLSATSAVAFYKSQHAPVHLASPRKTRSKALSFQKAESPQDGNEDMSIQLARAALESTSRSKVSHASAYEAETDWLKRLGNDMPDCLPLKDLKFHNRNNLDFAVVATSHPTPPKRTKARQYATSLTVTDPSIAPDVIEVSLFRAHKDFLPIVKPGDSCLFRGFTVVSLPERGFGLQTHPDESSWAVIDTDGADAVPQIRGPPVELEEDEKRYLVDLRAWYAALDDGSKDKLAEAVGALVEKGRESRGEK
ncbi:hypothetical protein SLS53_000124 [Cytospora paraplurivora]|uniref:Telomeric single stranded DNA binding POT1/Cdc13 domain-containing protein n=1 Tax=Cytospora paraplurivora TaxID=2898453 RepID=A0AAN9UL64_9PEZI